MSACTGWISAQRLGKAGLEKEEGRSFIVERGGADKERQYKNAMETWRQMVYRSGSSYLYVFDNWGGGGRIKKNKSQ